MYHRARAGRHGNPTETLDAHFAHIAANYAVVSPGEPLSSERLNVCLTFDDGYFDFYARVFPLLEKHHLRAVLAIPPAVIRDAVDATTEDRLDLDSAAAFAGPRRGGFCTWPELTSLAESGRVTLAAHGMTHVRLDGPDDNLTLEVESPGVLLKTRTGSEVDSFVFPFGRFSAPALDTARSHYTHVFRIGGALNRGWGARVLYRVDADAMTSPSALFEPAKLLRYRARYFWNQLRRR